MPASYIAFLALPLGSAMDRFDTSLRGLPYDFSKSFLGHVTHLPDPFSSNPFQISPVSPNVIGRNDGRRQQQFGVPMRAHTFGQNLPHELPEFKHMLSIFGLPAPSNMERTAPSINMGAPGPQFFPSPALATIGDKKPFVMHGGERTSNYQPPFGTLSQAVLPFGDMGMPHHLYQGQADSTGLAAIPAVFPFAQADQISLENINAAQIGGAESNYDFTSGSTNTVPFNEISNAPLSFSNNAFKDQDDFYGPTETFFEDQFFDIPPSGEFLSAESMEDIAAATEMSNFYEWSNKEWLKDETIAIPDGYPMWGTIMEAQHKSNLAQVELLNQLLSRSTKKMEPVNTVASLSPQEEATLRQVWSAIKAKHQAWAKGLGDYEGILEEFELLDNALPPVQASGEAWVLGLAKAFSHLSKVGIDYPFHLLAEVDFNDPSKTVLYMGADGLSMPARALYVKPMLAMQRKWFQEHVQKTGSLVGIRDLEFGQRVLRFEEKLAKMNMPPALTNKHVTFSTATTLDKFATGINGFKFNSAKYEGEDVNAVLNEEEQALLQILFSEMVDELGLRYPMVVNYAKNYPSGDIDEATRMVVRDGDYFRGLFKLLFDDDEENRKDVIAYLQYKIIDANRHYSTQELSRAFFDFYNRKLENMQEQDQGLEALTIVNNLMKQLVGKAYVAAKFPEEKKFLGEKMISNLIRTMGVKIESSDKFSASAKEEALRKLDSYTVKIGYPSKWQDYDLLGFEEGDDLKKISGKVKAFQYKTEFLQKLNVPVANDEWKLGSQDVNAYFHVLLNEIVFPAGILSDATLVIPQSGGTEELTPDLINAMNYGAFGFAAAHEIMHGFDSEGRNYDALGIYRDWWTPQEDAVFKREEVKMAKQAENWTWSPSAPQHSLAGEAVPMKSVSEGVMPQNMQEGNSPPPPTGAVPMIIGPDGKLMPLPEGAMPQNVQGNSPPPAGAVPMILGPDGKLMPLPEGSMSLNMQGNSPPAATGAVPMIMGPDGKLIPLPDGAGSETFAMNVQLTMGENLADVEGLHLAVSALKETANFQRASPRDQKKQLQHFFLSYAHFSKMKIPDVIMMQVLTQDPHGPPSFRGNLVKNIDEFYDAFDVQPDDEMFITPEERVSLWQ